MRLLEQLRISDPNLELSVQELRQRCQDRDHYVFVFKHPPDLQHPLCQVPIPPIPRESVSLKKIMSIIFLILLIATSVAGLTLGKNAKLTKIFWFACITVAVLGILFLSVYA